MDAPTAPQETEIAAVRLGHNFVNVVSSRASVWSLSLATTPPRNDLLDLSGTAPGLFDFFNRPCFSYPKWCVVRVLLERLHPCQDPPVRFRMRAVALVPAGKPITTAAVEMGVSATATHNWARQDQIDREEAPGITTPQTMELVKAKKRIRQTRNRRRDSEGRSEAARGGFPQPKRIHLVGLPCRVVREPRDGNARPLRVKARTLTAVRCPNQCPPGRRINSANVTGACKSRPVSQLSRSPNASPIQLETSGTEPSGDSGYARSRRNPARFVSTSTMAATTSIKRAID